MIKNISGLVIPKSVNRYLISLAGVGLLIFVAGLFTAPGRIWPNFLIAEFYLISLGLGGAFFIAVLYVSNAGWGTAFRRIPEAVMSTLPAAAIGGIILIFGVHTLYEWSHHSVVVSDDILSGKAGWLNKNFFIGRLVFYFFVWIFFAKIIEKNSRLQDQNSDALYTGRNVRNSAIFIILGAYTFALASIDLLMSLQPHWYSTVFGFLSISGMFLSGLAIITVFMVIMRNLGYKHIYTTDHLHDMGRLLMSFSVFWVYMWVSQHMLIWYSNIPEETSYYIFRHFGGWGSLSFLNVILNWLIPFLVLLPRSTKRNDKIMLYMAVVILIGHWLDLYIMVMPTVFGAEPAFGIWEIGPMIAVLSVFFWMVLKQLSKGNLIPVNDPYLVESLPRHEH
ncbi:MAG: hypothetical protein AB7W47_03075 [Calditrichaceae bacterium]